MTGDTPVPDKPLSLAERQSFLQAMYKEQCDQARQHETMRQQVTTIAMALVGTVVSFAAASGGALGFFSRGNGLPNIPPAFFALYSLLGFFVIGIGHHGRKLSLKHYERNRTHTARARAYRKRLEELFPRCGDDLRKEAERDHENRWKRDDAGDNAAYVIKQRLYRLWVNLFLFVNLIGVFLIVIPLVVAVLLQSRS
jgi:hypothetical protein